MSKMAKEAREAMKRKVTRLVEQADPKAKVDGSSYEPPEMLDADVQTGMRPISRRQFRRGGVVTEGEAPKKRADKRRRRTRRDRERTQYEEGGGVPPKKMASEDSPEGIMNSIFKRADDMKAGKESPTNKELMARYRAMRDEDRGATNPRYNKDAVDKAIASSNRYGRRIRGKEAKAIHGLLRGGYKDGGSTPLTSNSLVNKDMKEANEEREGKKHIGGLKKGGRAERAAGGMGSMRIDPMQAMMAQNHPARRAKDEREQRVMRAGRKSGGRAGKSMGGVMEALSPAYALYKNRDKDAVKGLSPIANMKSGGAAHSDEMKDTALIKKALHKHEEAKHPGSKLTKLAKGGMALSGQMQGTRPTGGRIARKSGGTVTNIYFDTKKGAEAPPGGLMPPPMPPMPPLGGPPGAPPGLPPGGPPMPPPHMAPPPGGPPGAPPGLPPGLPPGGPPMMRRAGGRVGHRSYKKPQDMDAGSGSGLGRLEKIQIQKGK